MSTHTRLTFGQLELYFSKCWLAKLHGRPKLKKSFKRKYKQKESKISLKEENLASLNWQSIFWQPVCASKSTKDSNPINSENIASSPPQPTSSQKQNPTFKHKIETWDLTQVSLLQRISYSQSSTSPTQKLLPQKIHKISPSKQQNMQENSKTFQQSLKWKKMQLSLSRNSLSVKFISVVTCSNFWEESKNLAKKES